VLFGGAGFELIWLTIFVSFAAQLGDIAESYIKRRCDTKDSSQLLPGHGGLWDRFDGLIGAAVAIVLIAIVMPVPEVGGPAPVAGVAD
jgi:phosphatidate cytidylyltransferase